MAKKKDERQPKDHVVVGFTPLAWSKMWLLVDMFDSEVAWNATCHRDNERDMFVVDDILVHKQKVTGGTVRTDPAEYDEWLGAFDDETFEKIRLHGHSHYTMAAYPSGLDEALQNDITNQLTEEMFYIFMIVNRHRNVWIKVVDMADGFMYWQNAVQWCVIDDGFHSGAFIEEAQKLVEKNEVQRARYDYRYLNSGVDYDDNPYDDKYSEEEDER